MARFVGVKHNRICVVSDNSFHNQDLTLIEVPDNLSHLSASELLIDCKIKDQQIYYKGLKKPASQLKVAFVGNWKMRCGIATFSENLWPEIIKHISDFKLFIEKTDLLTGDIYQLGDQILSDQQVVMCWERGKSLSPLVKEIKEYDPDIVFIQHEFGLWPNAAYWLAMLSQLSEYRVICTMHSVFHHKDKTIVEAAIPEIVVHLDGAKKLLEEKGVISKITVIPHGCYSFTEERLWNFYHSNYTFMQQGFGFEYKNFEASIQAAAILKNKYPNVFFTALISESPYNMVGHTTYYNKLMSLVSQYSLEENVSLIRGFQSDQVIDSYLRTNQVAVFPYISIPGHEVFGASGAARLAMSKNTPIITSSIPHFSDVPSIKADTPEEIAAALEKLFTDPVAKQQQLQNQIQYIQDNTWEKIGLRYKDLFEN